jgi:hypothetical protein
VTCEVCKCETSIMDSYWSNQNSQLETHALKVSPEKECRITFTGRGNVTKKHVVGMHRNAVTAVAMEPVTTALDVVSSWGRLATIDQPRVRSWEGCGSCSGEARFGSKHAQRLLCLNQPPHHQRMGIQQLRHSTSHVALAYLSVPWLSSDQACQILPSPLLAVLLQCSQRALRLTRAHESRWQGLLSMRREVSQRQRHMRSTWTLKESTTMRCGLTTLHGETAPTALLQRHNRPSLPLMLRMDIRQTTQHLGLRFELAS